MFISNKFSIMLWPERPTPKNIRWTPPTHNTTTTHFLHSTATATCSASSSNSHPPVPLCHAAPPSPNMPCPPPCHACASTRRVAPQHALAAPRHPLPCHPLSRPTPLRVVTLVASSGHHQPGTTSMRSLPARTLVSCGQPKTPR